MRSIIEAVNTHLDTKVAEPYKDQPLAQDWARVAKAAEEISEVMEAAEDLNLTADDRNRLDECTLYIGRAVDALIRSTGQNPRKGVCGTQDEMLKELADVVCTALFAIQHFTQDARLTADIIEASLLKAMNRVTGPAPGAVREPASNVCPLGHVKPAPGCDWCEENIDPVTWRKLWSQR